MERFPIQEGLMIEQSRLSAGLDYYKPTMSQLVHEQEPDAEVTFTFKNRGEQRLMDYIDPTDLQAHFDFIQARGWSQDELDYLGTLRRETGEPMFASTFIDYLRSNELPKVSVMIDEETQDLAIETTGPWALATFWETVVMSEINEMYFENFVTAHGLDLQAIYEEGDRRLSEKIALLQQNPDIKFADFGTRRHFSLRWQKHVVDRLMAECPGNIIGTSNVGLAHTSGLRPIGTFAHEMPMVYAGLADARGQDIRASHNQFLRDWFNKYGEQLSTALTDTFTTEFFFSDFTPEQAQAWKGVRHDSGDPVAFGERLIQFYEDNGIDPRTKTCVFSDGLDMNEILKLNEHFKGRINLLYGWGTSLTNDLGIKALNIVMKATRVQLPDGRSAETVKLSDNPGKHTGPQWLVNRYAEVDFATKKEQNDERIFTTV